MTTDGPGTWEPRWDRPVLDAQGNQKRDAEGNLLWEHARLDLRLEGGPEEPTTYGDVVVSQTRAESWVRLGASADGAVAAEAAARKGRRYPPEQVPGAKLVAFSVEAGGGGAPALRISYGELRAGLRSATQVWPCWGARAGRRCTALG